MTATTLMVALQHRIPVYITYFTLKVNDDGSISTYGDIYGHDSRMAAALKLLALEKSGEIPLTLPGESRAQLTGLPCFSRNLANTLA